MANTRRRGVLVPLPHTLGEQEVHLPSGRTVTVGDGDDERITVRAPDGHVELRVRFSEEGPVLTFEAAQLALQAKGELSVDCDQLRLRARGAVELESGGTMIQRAGGDHRVVAEGHSEHKARSVHLESDLGDVEIKANDDLKLHAERVRLN